MFRRKLETYEGKRDTRDKNLSTGIAKQAKHDPYGSWHLYICSYLSFSFRSLDLFVASLFVCEGHFALCYKGKIEPLDRAMANFKRS